MPHQKLLSIRLRITNAHQHMHICYSHLNSLKGKHNQQISTAFLNLSKIKNRIWFRIITRINIWIHRYYILFE